MSKNERQDANLEKIFVKDISVKDLVSKIYKLNCKKTNNEKNKPKTLTDASSGRYTDGKYLKIGSTSRKCKLKQQ